MARIIEERSKHPGISAARPGALKVAETVAELVVPRSRELHMKVIAVFTHSDSRRAGVAYRPLGRFRVFSGSGDAEAHGADLGRAPGRAGLQKVTGCQVAEKPARRAAGAQGDVIGIVAAPHGDPDDELHEVSYYTADRPKAVISRQFSVLSRSALPHPPTD